ncbi:MAG: amidohydrolase family protein [Alphaproteobacteria bacterium]|nr:amidohydrolase family protein [Alphaproteobacteria bacterium]
MTMLVHGRWVIPDADGAVIDNGAVLVEGGRIAALGSFDELAAQHPEAGIFGGERYAVMPGLINAHHHSGAASHVQHGGPDMLLESWLKALWLMRPTPTRLDILLSATRLLQSGVTAVVDLYSPTGNQRAVAEDCASALAAYDEIGIRCGFAPGVKDQGFLGVGPGSCDEDFLAALPDDLAARARAHSMVSDDHVTPEAYIELMEDLIGGWRDDERVDVWYGPAGPPWITDRFFEMIGEAAERHDVNIQTHVSESFYEKLQGPKFAGRAMLLHLHDIGLTSPRFSIAHGVWMNDAEIAVMAGTGTAVSHNPSSNLRLRAGIAPLNAFLEAGVTTAIGMDSTTINDDEDMFAEMRLALRLARTPSYHEPAPEPADILRCATQGGAKLMRKDGKLGRLAPGYAADLVLVDLTAASHPWIAPEVSGRDLVLYKAKGGDVSDVMVAGEWVLHDGKPTRFNLDEAVAELAGVMAAEAFPQEDHALAQELLPHIEAWYGAWDHGERQPHTAMNSRV